MEIQKITYENKEYIRNDPQYSETETVTDGNMNEIKKVVNNNADKQDEDYLKLKNALINAETEEAKSLHVTDANKFGQLEVLGNHEQETREGYNIINITAKNRTSDGVTMTINEDGSVTFNGTATARSGGFSLLASNTSWSVDDFPYNEDLTLKCEGIVEGINFAVSEGDESGAWIRNILGLFGPNSKTTGHFEKGANAKYIRVNFTILEGTILNNVIVYPILYKGTDDKLFEKYGASPSPNYPSKIFCLGSNVKNIFTETNVLSDVYLNFSHEIVENQDYVMYYFEVEPNQNYVLSFKYTQNLVELGKIGYGFSDSVPFIGQKLEAEDTYSIFGNKVNGKVIIPSKKYLIFNFIKSMYNTMYDIQLEKGTEVTSYSPPGQGSTKISKINKNLFNGSDVYNGYITGTAGQKISYQSSTLSKTYKNCCKLIKDKNYTLSFNKNNPANTNTKICVIADEDENILQMFNLNPTQEAVLITPDQTGYLYLVTDVNATNIQIEGGTIATDYVEHEQTDYILYIQQEMLKGDYFVKEDDGWKEVHGFGKYVFDGTENYVKSPLSDDDYLKTYTNTSIISAEEIKFDGKMFATRYKNIGIYSSSTTDNRIACRSQLHTQISTEFLTENTAEAYKALLAEWKNEGNPLTVFYELINPTKLACTEEQSAVLEELNNLSLFNGVNNIITAEDIALLKLKYALNAKIYIDNLLVKQSENTVAEEV